MSFRFLLGKLWKVGFAAVIFVTGVAMPSAGSQPLGGQEGVLMLAEAESLLMAGDADAAYSIYKEAFENAGSFEERLAYFVPLARAGFVAGRLPELFRRLPELASDEEPWRAAVYRAAIHQFLENFQDAKRELQASLTPDNREILLPQVVAWAERLPDPAERARLLAERFDIDGSPEARAAYVDAMIDASLAGELAGFIAGQAGKLAEQADFWRRRLPGLRPAGVIDAVAPLLRNEWEAAPGWEPAFALAELLLFEGRVEEARDRFWRLAAAEEIEVARHDGEFYFQRLNVAFHNRFVVKRRVGSALDRYGPQAALEYKFLGIRDDPAPTTLGKARDVALLYALELHEGSSEDFVRRLREALDTRDRPAAQRILAFAVVSAPVPMVEEIEAFAAYDEHDSATADFALLAMNRFVLGVDSFPGIDARMAKLTHALDDKFYPGREPAMQRRTRQTQEQLRRRLGFDQEEPASAQKEKGSREWYLVRIAEEAHEGRFEESEKLFREMRERLDAEEPAFPLLMLANAWAETEPRRAASLIAEFLRGAYRPARPGGNVQVSLRWSDNAGFPPPNPFLSGDQLEILFGISNLLNGPVWELFVEEMSARLTELDASRRATAGMTLMTLHWWRNERAEAARIGRELAATLGDPVIDVVVAYAVAGAGEREEAIERLRQRRIAGRADARRLLFALAARERRGELAGAAAGAIVGEQHLQPEEKIDLAEGLIEVERVDDAAAILSRVNTMELGDAAAERRQAAKAVIMAVQGRNVDAGNLARTILLGTPPNCIQQLMTPVRRAALQLLFETGALDDHAARLKEALDISPQSPAIHLLLGEAGEFLYLQRDGRNERRREMEAAAGHYKRAIEIGSKDPDSIVNYIDWLVSRSLWERAVIAYEWLMEKDAALAFIDLNSLYHAYRQVGRLERLVDILTQWRAPEAYSLDEFYGIQPTVHIMLELGKNLHEEGLVEAALSAWLHGLSNNPVEFTEEMRELAIATLVDLERVDVAAALVVGYAAEASPDPIFFKFQPFMAAPPRWIHSYLISQDREQAPLNRFLEILFSDENGKSALAEAISAGRETGEIGPDPVPSGNWVARRDSRCGIDARLLSLELFAIYIDARFGIEDWRERLKGLREELPPEKGRPSQRTWWEAERFFEEFVTNF